MKALLVKIKSGKQQGLLGFYGRICEGCSPEDSLRSSLSFERIDPEVNFIWIDDPAPGIPLEGFVAVWEGYLSAVGVGSCRFFLSADDGARLFLNGELLIDSWRQASPQIVWSDAVDLGAGIHRLRLEYYNEGVFGRIMLGWERDGVAEILPSERLYTTPSRSVIITGIPRLYRAALIARGVVREAVFRGGVALIPLDSSADPVEGLIKIYDEEGSPVYMSPYINIWPGDVFSLEIS